MDSNALFSLNGPATSGGLASRADYLCPGIGRYGHQRLDILDAPAADLFLLKAQSRRQGIRRADTCLSEFADLGFADSLTETDIHSMFPQKKKMKTILILIKYFSASVKHFFRLSAPGCFPVTPPCAWNIEELSPTRGRPLPPLSAYTHDAEEFHRSRRIRGANPSNGRRERPEATLPESRSGSIA
jgi:hypothetical protein